MLASPRDVAMEEGIGAVGELPVAFQSETEVNRRGSVCLGCLLAILLLFLFFNADGIIGSLPPEEGKVRSPPGSHHGSQKHPNSPHAHSDFDAGLAYTLTFSGEYILNRTASLKLNELRHVNLTSPGFDAANDAALASPVPDAVLLGGRAVQSVEVERGTAHILLITKRTVINSIRLTNIRIILENSANHIRQQVVLGGLDLRDVKNLIYHGRTDPRHFFSIFDSEKGSGEEKKINRSPLSISSRPDHIHHPRSCALSAVLRFNKLPQQSVSIRPLDPSLNLSAGQKDSGVWRRLMGLSSNHRENITDEIIPSGWNNGKENEEGKVNGKLKNVEGGGVNAERLFKRETLSLLLAEANIPDKTESTTMKIPSDLAVSVLETNTFDKGFKGVANGQSSSRGLQKHKHSMTSTNGTADFEHVWPDSGGDPTGVRAMKDLEGQIISSECGFWISFSADEVDIVGLSSRVIQFAFAFNIKVLLEMKCYISQVADCELGHSASKLSMTSLGMHLVVDAFEGLFLMSTGLNANFMLSSFSVMALFKLFLIAMLEIRLILAVWRSHYEDMLNVEPLRREAINVIRRFVGIVTLVLFVFFRMSPYVPFALVPLYCFWAPQIAWDAWKGQRRSVNLQFLLGLSACRLALPIYLWALPPRLTIFDGEVYESMGGSPNIPLCVVLCSVVAVQVALSLGQRHLGSRFFVPARWLPEVYNYYRPIPRSVKPGKKLKKPKKRVRLKDKITEVIGKSFNRREEDDRKGEEEEGKAASSDEDDDTSTSSEDLLECVICMAELDPADKRRVITPCEHLFHESCLRQWMDVKMECPTCRGQLPPFA